MSRETKILGLIIAVVVAGMIGIFALANKSETPKANSTNVTRENSHKLGSGPVTVVEFGDYQCPACGAAYPDTKRILADYGSKINFVFRNFPLPMHPNAPVAAAAAEAAGAQGKFWEMHDKLYETQNEWSSLSDPTDKLVEYATQVGLDAEKFKQDVKSNAQQSIIDQDKSDASTLNLTGTPSFFVNGSPVTIGSSYYDSLKSAIESAQ